MNLSFGIVFVNGTEMIDDLPTKINQNVHFVDIRTWKVYEHYEINGVKTMLQLGFFDYDFNYITLANPFFEERRGNFQGYKTKVKQTVT